MVEYKGISIIQVESGMAITRMISFPEGSLKTKLVENSLRMAVLYDTPKRGNRKNNTAIHEFGKPCVKK